jgi:hypothetical protein
MAIKYSLPKNQGELDKLITSAITSAKTMRDKVQVAAVAILHHAYTCGDWTQANVLVEGLGHGVKRDSLVEYFAKMGGLTIAEGANEFTGWSGKDHIKANFDKAKEVHWHEYNKANPFKGFNFEGEINKLLARKAKVEKGLDKLDDDQRELVSLNVNEGVLQALAAACNFELMLGEQPANDIDAELVAELKKVV